MWCCNRRTWHEFGIQMTHFCRTYAYYTPPPPLSRQRESTTTPPRLGFFNRPTRLEVWALQKLTVLEIYCHAWIRRGTFPRYLFAVSLLPISALTACTSLLLSQTMALVDANEVCEQRFAILMPMLTSYQEEILKASGVFTKLTPGLMHITCTHSLPPL